MKFSQIVGRISNPSVLLRSDWKSVLRTALIAALVQATCQAAAPITSLAFSPDGKQVIAASQAKLTIFTWPSLEEQKPIKVLLPQVHDLKFSPDQKHLAIVGGAPAEWGGLQVVAWPPKEAVDAPLRTVADDVVFQTAWVDDNQLAIASTDGQLFVVNRQGEVLRPLKGHSRHVLCVVPLDDHKTLISGGADASIRVWETETGKVLRTLGNHTAAVRDLAVRHADDGLPMVASAGADKTVRLWQPTIGRMVRFARLESAPLAIAWTASGDHLLVACEDGHLRVIDANSTNVVLDNAACDGWSYAVQVSPDGNAVIAGENQQIKRIALSLDQSP